MSGLTLSSTLESLHFDVMEVNIENPRGGGGGLEVSSALEVAY